MRTKYAFYLSEGFFDVDSWEIPLFFLETIEKAYDVTAGNTEQSDEGEGQKFFGVKVQEVADEYKDTAEEVL